MSTSVTAPPFVLEPEVELLLFGGKGGVGKTSCAVATALVLAERRSEVAFLLVSTDPAHSVLDSLDGAPRPANLEVVELDAAQLIDEFTATNRQRFREIAARGTFLDEADIESLLDLSLPGMDELMAFLEISRWLGDGDYGAIVVDTAPTGHTLGLLAMPTLIGGWLEALDALLGKHRYMKKLFTGRYERDDLDEFLLDLSASVERVRARLSDPVRCRFVPVMVAEDLSILETRDLLASLERLEVPVRNVVVNRVTGPSGTCSRCAATRSRQLRRLLDLPWDTAGTAMWTVPLHAREVRGGAGLASFWQGARGLDAWVEDAQAAPDGGPGLECPVVQGHAPPPSSDSRLLVFAGKGGVGKTTMAAATALWLARRDPERGVLLFSTDPAHSLSACLDMSVGPSPTSVIPGLDAVEIDAAAELDALKSEYSDELEGILGAVSPNLDLTFDREVMERILDLAPAGLDEVMALMVASQHLAQGDYGTLVLDSAPTGHLLRLLEMPQLIDRWLKAFFELLLKYKHIFRPRRVTDRLVAMSKDLKRWRSAMADSQSAALYAVAIPTGMALAETRDLVAACGRLEVNVGALLVNQATPPEGCEACDESRVGEGSVLRDFDEAFVGLPRALIYRGSEPRGADQLRDLGDHLYGPATVGGRAMDQELTERDSLTLCEALDRVLNQGVVICGEVTISVADVDLVYVGLQAILCSVDAARRYTLGNPPHPGRDL